MNSAKKYGGIEYFRLAAAFLVVAIHCSPLASYSAVGDFILTRVLARTAVPFFFMVTGRFVLDDRGKAVRFLRRTALLYAACIVIYLPLNIYNGELPGLRELLLDGTLYHLWYFPAVLLGVAIALPLSRSRCGFPIALALYLAGLLGDSYFGLVRGVPVLSDIYEAMGYTRNGLFFAPLFLLLGQRMRPCAAGRALPGLCVSLALMLCEALTLRQLGWQKHDSMYLMLPCVMYFLFSLLLDVRAAAPGWCGGFSMLVYVLHPWAIVLVRGFARFSGLWQPLVESSLGHYLAVCAGTAAASAVLLPLLGHLKPCKPYDRARAWVEVDAEALRHNAKALMGLLPAGCELMPVLKCGAYGHGAVKSARVLEGCGVRAFAVACAAEGVELRRAGIRGTILVLGWTAPENFPCLVRYRLTQTVTELPYAEALSAYGRKLDVHIKIDTGMHRLGMDAGDIDTVERIFELPYLRVTGMYTHLCVSDSLSPEARSFTEAQSTRFFVLTDELKRRGHDVGKLHTQASYGLLNYPDARCSYARVGIALYGLKSAETDDTAAWPGLRPVLSLKARVAQVRELPMDEGLGYGLAYTTTRPGRIAVLTIGYGDGCPRGSEGAQVWINGKRARIVGRVCMDQTIIDVTDCGKVYPGDEAIFDLPALARQNSTITNELLSRLNRRLPRVWLK